LPKELRLKNTEFEIVPRGDETVVQKKAAATVRAFQLLAGLPDDIKLGWRGGHKPQKRQRFSEVSSPSSSLDLFPRLLLT
jgi:hypothetical protein